MSLIYVIVNITLKTLPRKLILFLNNMSADIESVELKAINFESTALNGLRGIAALHITLFHALESSEYEFDTLGQVNLKIIHYKT